MQPAVPGGTQYFQSPISTNCSARWYAIPPNPHLYYLQCQVERRCNLQYQVVCNISNPCVSVSSVPGGTLSQTAIPGGMQHSEPSHPSISAVPGGTLLSTAVPGGMQFFPIPIAPSIDSKFLFPICYSFCSARAHTYACCSIPDGTKFCLWQVERILCSPYLGHPVSCVHRCHQHR